MEKKEYVSPDMEIICFETTDVMEYSTGEYPLS